nr:MBL fold metallo-hydrolase [Alicyclobacillus mali (ex Roth et al. 2021)]
MDVSTTGRGLHVEIRRFVISPIQSNCYVLAESWERGANAVVIDPGDLALDPVFSFIDEVGLKLVANWNTHGHFDHVIGVDHLRQRYGVPSYLHRDDLVTWNRAPHWYRAYLADDAPDLRQPDAWLQDGDELTLGDETFTVWHTPGHSPGSVCLVGKRVVFSGDTLFAGTIGRVDLEGSDPGAMQASLKRILQWPDELEIYPGHGPATRMGHERKHNRFLLEVIQG